MKKLLKILKWLGISLLSIVLILAIIIILPKAQGNHSLRRSLHTERSAANAKGIHGHTMGHKAAMDVMAG